MPATIAVFVNHPHCSVQSANGLIQALSTKYKFKIFNKSSVEYNFFDNVDCVAFPGGLGDSDSFNRLLVNNKSQVLDFVHHGGKYLGICMGAYWADRHYFNLLDNVRAVQYIKRPGTDTRRPHAKAQKINWQGQEQRMFFYDGCALIGKGCNDSEIYAHYPNNDVMALIQGNIGVIGCHPESERVWYEQYSYMLPFWHNQKDHKLLLNFVDNLLER